MVRSKSWLNKHKRRRIKKEKLIEKVCYFKDVFVRALTKEERKTLVVR